MKRQRVVVIAGLIITIAVTGCGNSDTPVEPTESVIETEIEEAHATEKIEETETEEEHPLFDPDEIGMNAEGVFSFKDQKTIAYIMNIPGVSDLSDEELDAFMSELAELVAMEEFNDVEQTESYIVSDLLPKYLEKQTATKETESKQPSSNNSTTQQQQSASTPETSDSASDNNEQAVDEYDDDNVRLDTPPSYDDGQVGPEDQYFFQDEGADWGGSAPGIQYTGHAAEDSGYSVGSTITTYYRGRDITLTYQGNDVWIDNEGGTWRTYVGVNGGLYWSTGIGG